MIRCKVSLSISNNMIYLSETERLIYLITLIEIEKLHLCPRGALCCGLYSERWKFYINKYSLNFDSHSTQFTFNKYQRIFGTNIIWLSAG